MRIGPDGCKRFARGARAKGLWHVVGRSEGGAGEILIATGWATGVAVHLATARTVICAMTDGNLLGVARVLRGRYPARRILILGDDDRDTAGDGSLNSGRCHAEEAAGAVRGVAVFPRFGRGCAGSDFDDLGRLHGLGAVRRQIRAWL